MIVPFPSGGPTDVLGRMLAQGRPELKDKLAALGLDAPAAANRWNSPPPSGPKLCAGPR